MIAPMLQSNMVRGTVLSPLEKPLPSGVFMGIKTVNKHGFV